jgi:NTE family protein
VKSVAATTETFRHMRCWGSALQSRLLGVPGNFVPRLFQPAEGFASLYDLAPLRERLEQTIDFDLLNSGSVRLSVMTTDLETGEGVLYDTAEGARITVDHLMASCGLPPEFPAVEIDGRVLGDGSLWTNAPIEPVLRELNGGLCVLVDTYMRQGERPASIESGIDRKIELMYANQTRLQLEAFGREAALRAQLAELNALVAKAKRKPELEAEADRKPPEILQIGYRAPDWEAGPERPFDYARDTLAARWAAGDRDVKQAFESAAA